MDMPIVIAPSGHVRIVLSPDRDPRNAHERLLVKRDFARRLRGWLLAHPPSKRPRF